MLVLTKLIKNDRNFWSIWQLYNRRKCQSSLWMYIHSLNIESHLTNFIAIDLKTHNNDRPRAYVFCFYRLSKIAGRYNRNLTPYEVDKCWKDILVFGGDKCASIVLDFCLNLKGEERKDNKNKVLGSNFQLDALNGSGFDTWIEKNILPCDKRLVNIIRNGKVIIELKV